MAPRQALVSLFLASPPLLHRRAVFLYDLQTWALMEGGTSPCRLGGPVCIIMPRRTRIELPLCLPRAAYCRCRGFPLPCVSTEMPGSEQRGNWITERRRAENTVLSRSNQGDVQAEKSLLRVQPLFPFPLYSPLSVLSQAAGISLETENLLHEDSKGLLSWLT